jgi:putative ABC transport system permease protein
MIGVGVVGLITIFVSSTKASMDAAVDRAFTGDIVVDSGGGFTGGVDPGLAKRIDGLPEVASAAGLRQGVAQVAGSPVLVQATDPRAAVELMKVGPISGSPADLGRDAIGLYKEVAANKGLHVGDPVPAVFKDTGPRTLRLALVYGENRQAGDYLLGNAAYEANFTSRLDSKVLVARAAGTSPETALAAVKQVAQAYPGVKVLDRAEFKAEQLVTGAYSRGERPSPPRRPTRDDQLAAPRLSGSGWFPSWSGCRGWGWQGPRSGR